MAIAAISLVFLMRALAESSTAASYTEEHLGARLLAREIVEIEQTATTTTPGTRSGEVGAYRWQMSVDPAEGELGRRAPTGYRLYRIVVEVAWAPRGLFRLDGLKLGKSQE